DNLFLLYWNSSVLAARVILPLRSDMSFDCLTCCREAQTSPLMTGRIDRQECRNTNRSTDVVIDPDLPVRTGYRPCPATAAPAAPPHRGFHASRRARARRECAPPPGTATAIPCPR